MHAPTRSSLLGQLAGGLIGVALVLALACGLNLTIGPYLPA
ncbi:MAG: hypothetical protein AB7O04_00630 [Hyphomonadaceae bacterium]